MIKLTIKRHTLKKMLKDFRLWMSNWDLCREYKIEYHQLIKYQDLSSFRHNSIDWIRIKRCKCCDVWKTEKEHFRVKWYTPKWTAIRDNFCNPCRRVAARNYSIVNNDKIRELARKTFRRNRDANKDKYNEERRVANMTPEQLTTKRKSWREWSKRRREKKIQEKLKQARLLNN